MIHKNVILDIPEDKCYKNTIKGKTYLLYEVGSEYVPGKKYNKKFRVVIGRVCDDDGSKFHPNRNYFEQYPNADQSLLDQSEKEPDRSPVMKIGMYLVIKQILEQAQLTEVINSLSVENRGLLMDLVAYMITEQTNVLQHFEIYSYNHPLFTKGMKRYSDSSISKFLKEFDYSQIQFFLDAWHVLNQSASETIYLSYDSTNKVCQSENIQDVDFGNAKVDVGKPIVNIAMAFNYSNKLPVYYEEYNGSIVDVAQLKAMVNKLKAMGFKNVVFILDRGYCSRENINYLIDNDYECIVMNRGSKATIDNIINLHKGQFENVYDYKIDKENIYSITDKRSFYNAKKELNYHLYYSPAKYSIESTEFLDSIDEMKHHVKKHTNTEKEFPKSYNKYLDIMRDKDNVIAAVRPKGKAIDAEISKLGYFEILTSQDMSSEDAYNLYKRRDASEKAFRSDKSFMGNNAIRVHSAESMKTKNFISFIALIVYQCIYNRLSEYKAENNIKKNYYNTQSFIKLIDEITVVKLGNGTYKPVSALTSKQKQLLTAIGIKPSDFEKHITEICKELTDLKKKWE